MIVTIFWHDSHFFILILFAWLARLARLARVARMARVTRSARLSRRMFRPCKSYESRGGTLPDFRLPFFFRLPTSLFFRFPTSLFFFLFPTSLFSSDFRLHFFPISDFPFFFRFPTSVARTIISGCDGPTEQILSFVGHILQPIAKTQKSYLKDTTGLY